MSPRQASGGLALATALIAGCAAQAGPTKDTSGYLTAYGAPVRDSFGDCWHTREWRSGMRFSDCEPKLAAAVAIPINRPGALKHARLPVAQPRPAPFKLATDTLFDFDSAVLRPEGRSALDKLETTMAHASHATVQVIGHTDRIGAASYNRELSERRAVAVRDYLAAQGLGALKIEAKGVGSSQPSTARNQCRGMRRAQLIRCLQPDRFAEVTITGTRS
jgi:OOP family OmpA-OmpF porin